MESLLTLMLDNMQVLLGILIYVSKAISWS